MSLHALASGTLVADAVRRSGVNGDYVTATLRVPTDAWWRCSRDALIGLPTGFDSLEIHQRVERAFTTGLRKPREATNVR